MPASYYHTHARKELEAWQKKMQREPGIFNRYSKRLQTKLNSYIPEKIHKGITKAIKEMIRGVLFGLKFTTGKSSTINSLEITEAAILEKIRWYKNTAAAEGGVTGAGGFLMAAADFPILIGIKMKMLFDIAGAYGFDVKDYKERLYILHIFQIAFSSQAQRKIVYGQMTNWSAKAALLPEDLNHYDWRSFQQEYRDYLDLAKMAQLVPIIGAAVGLVVNYRLLKQLGHTAMNAYRMRLFDEGFL
jgi:hypothetical protein